MENDQIILNAMVNGVNGRYIFDTGAIISLVPDMSTKNLRSRGYTLRYKEGEKYKQRIYELKSIIFDELEVNALSLVTNDPFEASYVYNKLGYTGLLGLVVFEGYWCEISFMHHKIILHREKPDYFTASVPVSVENKYNSHIRVPISIDGQELNLMVDTGMKKAFRFPKSLIDDKSPDDIRLV
jgi:hypothetical protein